MLDSLALEKALDNARAGDRAALSEVLSSLEPKLLRMVELRLSANLRQRLEPHDIVQETLLEATRRFAEWSPEAGFPFLTWLRILCAQSLVHAQRIHLGAQKRDAGREQHLRARPDISTASAADYFIASQTSPSQAVQREELRALILRALEELEPLDREILVLRQFEGLANEQAALELGIEAPAASKRFTRALQRLRQALRTLEHP